MGKNRDRVSIVAAILEAAYPGVTKTHIMVKANLSFSLLEKYLEVVMGVGLVRVNGSTYHLTERGHEFLREYKHFNSRYVLAQKLLDSLTYEREKLALICNDRVDILDF